MKNIIYCDRCKTIAPLVPPDNHQPHDNDYSNPIGWRSVVIDSTEQLHLCSDCIRLFSSFLEQK